MAPRIVSATRLWLPFFLLFPAPGSSQRPALPGKLSVTSAPAGAGIVVDNQETGKATPFTFVVSPGQHLVSLTSSSLPKCKTPTPVTVSSGSTQSVHCTADGWGNPPGS